MDEKTITGTFYAIFSAVCLGSTYIPLKHYDRGDGLYFQWVQSMGQLIVGVALTICSSTNTVIPIAMMNGMFYSIGNSLTIFIMDGIGMAIGYLLWNSVACIVGWAVTRFGLFFNPQQIPKCNWLNIMGVVTICIGSVIYAPIKHIPLEVRPAPWTLPMEKTDKTPTVSKKILCLFLTVFVGFLYGNFYSPINFIMTSFPGSSSNVQMYFLSYCLGTFTMSTVIFLGYCITMKNVPRVNPELSLPSIVSGVLYGIGMISFFMACQNLDQVIAYPILSKAPGIIVSLWAILLFKEIQGRKNIIQLHVGIGVTIIGISMISVSKLDVLADE